MEQEKVCRECGKRLPISEFNKCKRNKDGLQDRCRECFSKYNKARYAQDRERFKRAVYEYKRNNPMKVLESRISTCAKNPNPKNAYKVVEQALIAGVLERPSNCYGCNCSDKEHRIEAHHHDYSKPLDVIWLCTPCHRRMDAQRRAQEQRAGSE